MTRIINATTFLSHSAVTATVATTTVTLCHRLAPSLLCAALWTAQKARIIKDYALDYNGLWNELLIEAYSPRYDSPESGLPRFARWRSNGYWFFKAGDLTVIVEW